MSTRDLALTAVTCAIDMRLGEKDREEALRLLVALTERVGAHRSCQSCHVAVNAADPASVHYREEWDSDQDFRQHLRSDDFRQLLVVLDLCVEEPRVLVEELSRQTGMSRLRTLRASVESQGT